MKSITKPIVILVISGVVATGAVFAYAHSRMTSVEHRADWIVATVSDKLELNDSQTAKLNTVKDELLALRNRMHSEHEATHAEILSMLEQPQLERQKVLNLIGNKTQLIQQEAPTLVNSFADFYDSLDEAQHQKLREHVSNMIEHRSHHMQNHAWIDEEK